MIIKDFNKFEINNKLDRLIDKQKTNLKSKQKLGIKIKNIYKYPIDNINNINVAIEKIKFLKNQILLQSEMSILAQANLNAQKVLLLLE